jgi:polyphosphate glucokinase
MQVLGIDIGGTSIKAAPVDLRNGRLTVERFEVPTPHPARPKEVCAVVREIVAHFDWRGPVGCTFPGAVVRGRPGTAVNLDPSWVGVRASARLGRAAGGRVTVLNDADAAGLAEMTYGAGRRRDGVVVLLTLGTGLGSALFSHGDLLPNTELGLLQFEGRVAGEYISNKVRKEEHLSWARWARRVNRYLDCLDLLVAPDFVIMGGGVIEQREKFWELLRAQAKLLAAALGNDAGIVGAALAAATERRPFRSGWAPPEPVKKVVRKVAGGA